MTDDGSSQSHQNLISRDKPGKKFPQQKQKFFGCSKFLAILRPEFVQCHSGLGLEGNLSSVWNILSALCFQQTINLFLLSSSGPADADVDANFSFALKGVSSFESFFFLNCNLFENFCRNLMPPTFGYLAFLNAWRRELLHGHQFETLPAMIFCFKCLRCVWLQHRSVTEKSDSLVTWFQRHCWV